MSAKSWTEAHRREAARRIYELAAELSASNLLGAESLANRAIRYSNSESGWRDFVAGWFDPARVDREVRRVRALAEGRLLREPIEWWAKTRNGTGIKGNDREEAESMCGKGYGLVRISRIRRAR